MKQSDPPLRAAHHPLPQTISRRAQGPAARVTHPPSTPAAPRSAATADAPAPDAVAVGLLTIADVARRLQVSERAVRRWIAEGRLAVVHLGRAVRVRPADLAHILAAGLPAGTPPHTRQKRRQAQEKIHSCVPHPQDGIGRQ